MGRQISTNLIIFYVYIYVPIYSEQCVELIKLISCNFNNIGEYEIILPASGGGILSTSLTVKITVYVKQTVVFSNIISDI